MQLLASAASASSPRGGGASRPKPRQLPGRERVAHRSVQPLGDHRRRHNLRPLMEMQRQPLHPSRPRDRCFQALPVSALGLPLREGEVSAQHPGALRRLEQHPSRKGKLAQQPAGLASHPESPALRRRRLQAEVPDELLRGPGGGLELCRHQLRQGRHLADDRSRLGVRVSLWLLLSRGGPRTPTASCRGRFLVPSLAPGCRLVLGRGGSSLLVPSLPLAASPLRAPQLRSAPSCPRAGGPQRCGCGRRRVIPGPSARQREAVGQQVPVVRVRVGRHPRLSLHEERPEAAQHHRQGVAPGAALQDTLEALPAVPRRPVQGHDPLKLPVEVAERPLHPWIQPQHRQKLNGHLGGDQVEELPEVRREPRHWAPFRLGQLRA